MKNFIQVTTMEKGRNLKKLISINGIFGLTEHPEGVIGRCLILFAPNAGMEVLESFDSVKNQIEECQNQKPLLQV